VSYCLKSPAVIISFLICIIVISIF